MDIPIRPFEERDLNRILEIALAALGTGGDPSHAPARRACEKAGFDRAIPGVTYYKGLRTGRNERSDGGTR